jgi:hypothetical protein
VACNRTRMTVVTSGGLQQTLGILELRPEAKVRLYTTPDLIVVESPGGARVTFAALRIEDKGNGADVSLCVIRLDKPVAFRAAVLDAHGTIQAGINLLHRVFTLGKKTEVLDGSRVTPVWKFEAKRVKAKRVKAKFKAKRVKAKRDEKNDRFDLFVIAHWQEWNEAGILWDERNSIAQCDKSGVSLGPMKLGAFVARFQRGLGLRYLPGYIG